LPCYNIAYRKITFRKAENGYKSFFKISYGVFIAGVEYEGNLNACVVNTATQATSEPAKILVTMLKTNLTTEMALKKNSSASASACNVRWI
jgi:flavin reductase (DIM6/NTAB) family NADH-FMN oxidoreductase RutF